MSRRPTLVAQRHAAHLARKEAETRLVRSDATVFAEIEREWVRRSAEPIRYGRLPRIPVNEVFAAEGAIDRLVAAGFLWRGELYEWGGGGTAVFPTAGAAGWLARLFPPLEPDLDPCDAHQRLADAR